jgi:hypothetical protein
MWLESMCAYSSRKRGEVTRTLAASSNGNSTAVTRMPFTLPPRACFAACVKLVISSFANFAITLTLSSPWLAAAYLVFNS